MCYRNFKPQRGTPLVPATGQRQAKVSLKKKSDWPNLFLELMSDPISCSQGRSHDTNMAAEHHPVNEKDLLRN